MSLSLCGEKLKVAVLVDSLQIPAWAWEMLRVIEGQGHATLSLVILNATPKPSGKKSSFIYRAYRNLDRRLFKVKTDAFQRKDIQSLPGFNAAILSVSPEQAKYSDTIIPEDIIQIKKHQPDILIRLGFRILKGEILHTAKHGIWSYHHGDNRINRGGPPCYWEVMQQWPESGSVLQILSDKLDAGKVLYRSWSRTDPLSVHRNANRVYWKSLMFIPRMLKRLHVIGETAFWDEINQKQDAPDAYRPKLYKPPGNLDALGHVIRLFFRNGIRKLNEAFTRDYWYLLIGNQEKFPPKADELKTVHSPKGWYYADPFVVKEKEQQWIFFEAFDYKTGVAHIRAGWWEDGKLVDVREVLKEPWHLSYPYIFRDDGSWYMVPESAENKTVDLYRCERFPDKWVKVRTLMEDVRMYDATLVKKDGLWWMFANGKKFAGASAFDELFLFWTDDLFKGDWMEHPMSPVVSDVKSSRPAGRLFEKEGKWYRPAQNSAVRYGHKIEVREIVKWDRDVYEEKASFTIEPFEGNLGVHTLNFSEKIIALDAFKRKK